MNEHHANEERGRARYLRDHAALDRAGRAGDFDALAALAAAIDPEKFAGVVDVFAHPELPEGSLRYHVRASSRNYVIPTAFAVEVAFGIWKRSGRRPSILDSPQARVIQVNP